jgi:hypothetical protein
MEIPFDQFFQIPKIGKPGPERARKLPEGIADSSYESYTAQDD